MSGYSGGYVPLSRPPRAGQLGKRMGASALAIAASKDPYGLAPNNRSGPLGIGSSSGFAAPVKQRQNTGGISPNDPRIAASIAANPNAAGAHGTLFAGAGLANAQPTPSAAAVNHYDLNTDPALQQIQALAGMSDQQAQAAALKQKQDQLLAYGDPTIAASILGTNDPFVDAVGKNPTSTVAQLGQSRDRNLKSLDDQLNSANLGYSGYRVTQEQQAGQDYQNALAQAAAGLNSNLGQIDSNLTAQLSANQSQLAQAISDAANRAQQQALSSGVDPGAIDPNALAAAAGGAQPPGGLSSGATYGAPAVGTTTSALLYALLGRKMDPRYDAFG